ncbi:hypothetical protein [Streptomyces sp. NPDC088725]|uniref:hypothetical protein n=1 Tax=Streptomyces sp. NPDC088725 TaxID=3365873 RepID=UPI003801DE66
MREMIGQTGLCVMHWDAVRPYRLTTVVVEAAYAELAETNARGVMDGVVLPSAWAEIPALERLRLVRDCVTIPIALVDHLIDDRPGVREFDSWSNCTEEVVEQTLPVCLRDHVRTVVLDGAPDGAAGATEWLESPASLHAATGAWPGMKAYARLAALVCVDGSEQADSLFQEVDRRTVGGFSLR